MVAIKQQIPSAPPLTTNIFHFVITPPPILASLDTPLLDLKCKTVGGLPQNESEVTSVIVPGGHTVNYGGKATPYGAEPLSVTFSNYSDMKIWRIMTDWFELINSKATGFGAVSGYKTTAELQIVDRAGERPLIIQKFFGLFPETVANVDQVDSIEIEPKLSDFEVSFRYDYYDFTGGDAIAGSNMVNSSSTALQQNIDFLSNVF